MIMKERGDCWNRFERKTLLTFTGYKNRASGVLRELDRVGMKDVHVQWQFPNPFDGVLMKHLRHIPCLERGGYMNCTIGHYSAIKTAYHLGCKTCLIMEDDIRFLNDLGEIEEYVDALPEDFDVALFDLVAVSMGNCGPEDVIRLRKEARVNDHWFRYYNMRSMACYALSRRAMERLIWLNEAAVTDPRVGKLRICDHFLDSKYMTPGMNLYCASMNVAIQKKMGTANSDMFEYDKAYRNMGIDMSQYAS